MIPLIIASPVEFRGAVFSPTSDLEAGELKYVVFWGLGCVKGEKLAPAKRDSSGFSGIY